MGALSLSQEEYDKLVIGIAEHQVDIAVKSVTLRRQGDSDAWRVEEESIMLMNILDALKHYDVDAEIFTDDEIAYNMELATQIVDNCPN